MEPLLKAGFTPGNLSIADQDRRYKTFQKPRVQLKNR
jgi:hypothetical protein